MQTPDNFAYIVHVDELLHTPDKPFCWDPACPDKEDQDEIARVFQWVQDGLMTPYEATLFVSGRTV